MKSSRDSKVRKSSQKLQESVRLSNRRRMLNIDPTLFALLLKVPPGTGRK
jgi:hypothetical protein